MLERDRPCFTIKIVSDQLDLHPQTIRSYERQGLIKPERSDGNVRLFSQHDLEKLRKIMTFRNMGINLPGIEVIMKLLKQIEELKSIKNGFKDHIFKESNEKFYE